MPMRMQAVYYRDEDGNEPVSDFIDALPPPAQEELDFKINMLNRLSPDDSPLAFPHSSQVDGQLRELRCHYGRTLYHILYQRSNNLFVLLHIVAKRSQQLAESDKAIARVRWDDFKARMDAPRRQPPRAVGHDAP